MIVPLSKNCTVPKGVPFVVVTVAVMVTLSPDVDGFGEVVSLVVVAAGLIVTVTALEALGVNSLWPRYCAVMLSAPPGRVDDFKTATPELFRDTVSRK
jgi:hypothetical protein